MFERDSNQGDDFAFGVAGEMIAAAVVVGKSESRGVGGISQARWETGCWFSTARLFHNLFRLDDGRGNPPARRRILYFLDGALECARKGSWKLGVGVHPAETDGYEGGQNKAPAPYFFANPELYNLDTDPTESYDVAPAHPEIVKEILADIDALIPTFPEGRNRLRGAAGESR